ncbi:MAG: class II aldolase/adducin family protein [Solirubrobacterales bacterium]
MSDTPTAVAAIARLASRAGLYEAFGHVSARDGDDLVITPTSPLGAVKAEDTVRIPLEEGAESKPEWAKTAPLEIPMHAAVYLARPDLTGIVRTHSPAAVVLGARRQVPPLVHGLAGQAGDVTLIDYTDLFATKVSGEQFAAALGDADCLLIRANGALATGASLARAAVRAFYLEERCRVAIEAGPEAVEITASELEPRSNWFEAETQRAWAWLSWRYGDDELDLVP